MSNNRNNRILFGDLARSVVAPVFAELGASDRKRFEQILGLAVHAPVAKHLRVAAEHGSVVERPDRPRLPERVLDGIALRLLVVRNHDVERDPQLLQDLPPPRRRRREDQRGRRRSRQISSSGQRLAHSAGTVS